MGNTVDNGVDDPELPVHPHTHGEHPGLTSLWASGIGSSPHAWGTPMSTISDEEIERFIPTRMGNTACSDRVIAGMPVHPHTHGEHYRAVRWRFTSSGSSPHAWGTQTGGYRDTKSMRFIPTRMGNTPGRKRPMDLEPVHPHTHGEHSSSYYPWKEITFYAFAIKRCIASNHPLSVAGDAFL